MPATPNHSSKAAGHVDLGLQTIGYWTSAVGDMAAKKGTAEKAILPKLV